MFTPPPSPLPRPDPFSSQQSSRPSLSESSISSEDIHIYTEKDVSTAPLVASSTVAKRRIGRLTTRWTVLIVPIVIIFITLSTKYISHPAAFHILTDTPPVLGWTGSVKEVHRRHAEPNPDPQPLPFPAAGDSSVLSGSNSAPTPTSSPDAATPLPTVPSSQPLLLPTPFPQPWDSDVGQNFSSNTCFAFFLNMVNSSPFRSCRPFSLLSQTSGDFTNAQEDLNLLNAIVWGTCNTNTVSDTCVATMKSLSAELQSACSADLADRNEHALTALVGLQNYAMSRTLGCLVEPTTNTYCYLNAVNNANPSDLYVYQVPFGLTFPASATPTCSGCVKSVLAIMEGALNGDDNTALQGENARLALEKSFGIAKQINAKTCGETYVTGSLATGSSEGWRPAAPSSWSWTLLGSVSLLLGIW